MKSTDETIELLRGIRTDIQSLAGDVHCTRDELSQRMEQLTMRMVESISEMAAFMRLQSELRPRLEKCEEAIASLSPGAGDGVAASGLAGGGTTTIHSNDRLPSQS